LGPVLAKFLFLVENRLPCYYTKVFKIINQENDKPLSTHRSPHQRVKDESAKKYGTLLLNFMMRIAILLEM